jgi:ferredoxin
MAILVTDNCTDCRLTECVTVCPVSCFHGDTSMLYIDPGECIECCACIPVCPVHAIYDSQDLPAAKSHWIAINKERAPGLPVISQRQPPLPTTEARRQALVL